LLGLQLELIYFVLGGIFKETDCGKWVHLVCALYVPGITFGEVTSLSKVMLFANTTPRWGNKRCTLCQDMRFSCTGVTIACDAGMCRSNFHVTWYDNYYLIRKTKQNQNNSCESVYFFFMF